MSAEVSHSVVRGRIRSFIEEKHIHRLSPEIRVGERAGAPRDENLMVEKKKKEISG